MPEHDPEQELGPKITSALHHRAAAQGQQAGDLARVARRRVHRHRQAWSAAAAVVLVGDTDLFDAAEDGVDPATLVGESVEGNSATVQAVVADEAFFVGPEDGGETILVYLPRFAGEQESPFDVEPGDKVSFTGTIKEVDEELLSKMQLDDAPEMNVGDLYVEADQISPTA